MSVLLIHTHSHTHMYTHTLSLHFSWLLRDPNMKLRTPYQPYLKAVKKYFAELFKVLVPLQSIYGGPIIAFQIENEFAHHPHATVLEAQEYMDTLYLVSTRLLAYPQNKNTKKKRKKFTKNDNY